MVRGNLLVIPIASSVLYVQPLFLQATSSPLPELKRVIAAAGGQVGMGEDLNAALDAMFGAPAPSAAAHTGGPAARRRRAAHPAPAARPPAVHPGAAGHGGRLRR